MSTSEQQMQQLIDQAQMLTAELAAQRLELDAAITALDQQTQTATAALSVTQAAIAQMGETETQKKTLNPKLVNPPDPFQGTDADWERYKFGFATWISTVDPTYPDLLRKAELEKKWGGNSRTDWNRWTAVNEFVRNFGRTVSSRRNPYNGHVSSRAERSGTMAPHACPIWARK